MPLDVERYRNQFPIARSWTYLNHAAVSPLSQPVIRAMTSWLDDVQQSGALHFDDWIERAESIRISAARLLNAAPEEVAFTANTSGGISLVATGLDWKGGDEVVSVEGEFPANYYPWKALEARGVTLRTVAQRDGQIPLGAIADALTPQTRAVGVSFVQFLSGYRLDLNELGRLCSDRGILLFVDAIQGWGAFPIDVKAANIAGLAAGAHKWLLGPAGCGILYVRRDLAERIEPSVVGWLSVEDWEDFVPRPPVWRKGAGRFECGTLNLAGIYGLGAAFELLSEVGAGVISGRILELATPLRRGLLELGYRIYGPTAGDACSGIVTFRPGEKEDANHLLQRFQAEGIAVSARSGMIRVSPHFYNTAAEINRVLELLQRQ